MMQINVEADRSIPGLEVARVTGVLDLNTAGSLKRRINARLDSGVESLVLNLTGVQHIDAFGLGAVASVFRRAREVDTAMFVVVGDERVSRQLRLCGVDRVMPVRSSTPKREPAWAPLEAA